MKGNDINPINIKGKKNGFPTPRFVQYIKIKSGDEKTHPKIDKRKANVINVKDAKNGIEYFKSF